MIAFLIKNKREKWGEEPERKRQKRNTFFKYEVLLYEYIKGEIIEKK